jgi:outer membrane protein OmpA-like peptidoglycan-associated protein
MSGKANRLTYLFLGAAIPLSLTLSGCSMVKKQELEEQLYSMRSEMESERRAEIAEGDRQVSDAMNGRMDGLSARMDGLEDAISALADDFDARVAELENALRFDAPIYFGFDEAEVNPQFTAYLDRFAEIVQQYYPMSVVTVEGFTDAVGTAEYNLTLGKRRADAVKAYLVDFRGMSSDRVRSVSYGEASDRLVSPTGHGPGQAGWENRRVALVIDHSSM